jgi:hypothetical protein
MGEGGRRCLLPPHSKTLREFIENEKKPTLEETLRCVIGDELGTSP